MLNIISFLINIIDQYVFWLYLIILFFVLFYLRSYLLARSDRINTVFSIEKEVAAHREGRAMSSIGVVLGCAAVLTAVKFYIVPTMDIDQWVEPTPTRVMQLQITPREEVTPTPTPTPDSVLEEPPAEATPTPLPRPTLEPEATPTVAVPTPQPAPAQCPDENVRITSPGMGAVVSGSVNVMGTANHGSFQFYKVEFSQGEEPSAWHVVQDIQRAPVVGGRLITFNSSAVPNGVYWLQLTVVDATGNFPPPCRVRITVQN
jgi:hypothetical protein